MTSLGQYQERGQATSLQGQRQSGEGGRDGSWHVQSSGGLLRAKCRAGFPLGRIPFLLMALVCVAVPLGDTWRGERLLGTLFWLTIVLKLGWDEQQRLPPWSPKGLLVPVSLGTLPSRALANRQESLGPACLCPCWCTAVAAGKGLPDGTAPPPRPLRNTTQFPWDQCPFPPRMSCEQGLPCCHSVPPISSRAHPSNPTHSTNSTGKRWTRSSAGEAGVQLGRGWSRGGMVTSLQN